MKRILLLAAGALGTAGTIALAAPASADTPQQSQLEKLGNSQVVHTFLYGNCEGNQICADPLEVSHPGVLNQFDFFRENLASQSVQFEASIDRFVKGIPAPPATADEAGENK
ncbi:DUF4148 domain-containing protein [Mycobacterium sp. ITM-2016-00318]|uniref:DUF4148 domain-containing protein n=1 Tax=Mycobacterium sp. ITM-2016-00318 TaxID=2099693 RepID=UPI000CF9CBFC|nr:DUF4148 domain-containing protein [Mycobacterium sp. ITM-2016-00318]WNG93592.1 DUF4148 domain-containing protein [Mycobacterium sp. ITM-2016-00318]